MRPTPRLLLAAAAAVLAGCGGTAYEPQQPSSTATLTENPGGASGGGSNVPSPECLAAPDEECTTQCGSAGACSDSNDAPTCLPPAESCANGADDDCDGLIDAQDTDCEACVPGTTKACDASCGSQGRRTCLANGLWTNHCAPPAEQCSNGSDDDCDGASDSTDPECQVCTPGQTRSCTTACGSSGSKACGANGQWPALCRAPVELCGNGGDDDCDGFADGQDPECQVCTPGQKRGCTTSCNSGGTEECGGNGLWGSCRLPTEKCDNGADDDCDGKVDHGDSDCTPVIHKCEDTEGGGCNGDMGYGDRCAASDNTGGCSAARFWAWCNRRNPEYPNIWDDWIYNWVDSRCDGAMAETGTQYSTWYCTSSSNDRYECTTPLVLSFDGAPVQLAEPGPATFSFTAGAPVHSSWPRAHNPWLVRDVNGNGRIDDGSELFGSDTLLPGGARARHGFAALAELDADGDGAVDARDPAFRSLRLWADADGDRRSGPGELRTLEEAGVLSLAVRYTVAPRCDRRGNCERERAAFAWRDRKGWARTGAVVDVYLATRPALLSPRALAARGPICE